MKKPMLTRISLLLISGGVFLLSSCKTQQSYESDKLLNQGLLKTDNLSVYGQITAPVFDFKNGRLIVKTDRYHLTWENGVMTQLQTLLPAPVNLTLPETPMKMSDLPNGLGSFHGNIREACSQHRVVWSHKLKKGPPSFAAQHYPNKQSEVNCEKIENGVKLTYRKLNKDNSAVLVQELTVDPDTGELVINQQGSSANPGVFGVGFSLMNLKPNIGFAVPYFGGHKFGAEFGREQVIGYAWPAFWSAGLIVGETPGGGSFMVFADDPKLGPKYLKIYNSGTVQGLGFEACGQAPYKDKKNVEICTWRFNTYGGPWMRPAERYRQWLGKAYNLTCWREGAPEWFKKIVLIWPTGSTIATMKKLSNLIAPEHVLIVIYGWARGFNRNCPLYRPVSTNLPKLAKQLHQLGYHYGVYTAHKLIDGNANPDLIKKHNLIRVYDGLSRDPAILDPVADAKKLLEKAKQYKGRFLLCIHPGSNAWITYYTNLMVDFQKKYHLDCFYQDVTGASSGSSGIIDGRSLHEGTLAAERAIRERLPQIVSIGEHWNEVCVATGMELCSGNYAAWFSPRHHQRLAKRVHPIQGYIFNDYSRFYNYKTPIRDTEKFHIDQDFIEVTGMLPVWTTTPDDDSSEAKVTLERAELFSENYELYYPEKTGQDVVACLHNPQGKKVIYVRKENCSYCYNIGEGRKLRYARIRGKSSLSLNEPVTIDGWIAYGDKGPIGLDPAKWYCVFPGEPKALPVIITEIPRSMFIAGLRVTDGYIMVSIGGKGTGTVKWIKQKNSEHQSSEVTAPGTFIIDLKPPLQLKIGDKIDFSENDIFKIVNNQVTGSGKWSHKLRKWRLGNITHFGYTLMPPRGGKNSETSLDKFIQLPKADKLKLKFSIGRLGGAGDGVHVIVRVNGKEILRKFSSGKPKAWEEVTVPLTDYAGKTVILSLAVDAGKSSFNLSNDQTIFSKPEVVE